MPRYRVSVNYQTMSGGNTAVIWIDATDEQTAIDKAQERVRKDRRRKVMKIDGGEIKETDYR
jgi:hypothetical protein